MRRGTIILAAPLAGLALAGCAQWDDMLGEQTAMVSPPESVAPAGYQPVADLLPLPQFMPGLGELWVQPETLPVGPYLGYDRQGNLANTIYMVPLDSLEAATNIQNLEAENNQVDHVDVVYSPGHAGLAEPHYHVILWHIDTEQQAALQ